MLRLIANRGGGGSGCKVAGGVRTLQGAGEYLAAAGAILGPEWVDPGQFRVGASALLAALST